MAKLYIKAVKNYGSWGFEVPESCSKALDPIDQQIFLLKGKK